MLSAPTIREVGVLQNNTSCRRWNALPRVHLSSKCVSTLIIMVLGKALVHLKLCCVTSVLTVTETQTITHLHIHKFSFSLVLH